MPHLINLSNADLEPQSSLDGYDAYDLRDNKLGSIEGVIANGDTMELRYLVVDTGGWFSVKQFVVPAGDVQQIDDDRKRVSFRTLTKDLLESGAYPRYDEGWWDRNEHEQFAAHERGIAAAYQHHGDRDHMDDRSRQPTAGTQRLQLLEERLKVEKERYQAGAVRLGKRLVEHQETVTVPVREERVIIERMPVDGQAARGEIGDQNETIEVPVSKERVTVGTETVVAEEVTVRMEAVERQEPVQATLRKEELDVEGEGDLVRDEQVVADRTAEGAVERPAAGQQYDRSGARR